MEGAGATGRAGQAASDVAKLLSQHVIFAGQAASFLAFDPSQQDAIAAGAADSVTAGAGVAASLPPPAQAFIRKKIASKASRASNNHFNHPQIPDPPVTAASTGAAAAAAIGAAAAGAATGAAAAIGAACFGFRSRRLFRFCDRFRFGLTAGLRRNAASCA